MITCLIVDDEPIARRGLKEYIAREGDMLLVGECENVSYLNLRLKEITPDVIFLDIEMPFCSAIPCLNKREDAPNAIITTAYEQYALHGYDFNVFDYLLKLISFDRFHKAIEKLRAVLDRNSSKDVTNTNEKDYLFLKTDHCLQQKIYFRDIQYIEAQKDYCCIHLGGDKNGPLLVRTTLNKLLAQLPSEQFAQVHRSFVVNIACITGKGNDIIKIGTSRIPISITFKQKLSNKIVVFANILELIDAHQRV